ncbi:MAG TPA: LURP-one-related family protein [Candidatus Dormibacteraeota bacterium]|nr:LURP-one-related family protein [Candidatus Dormibacteraeota bacterium]
MQQAGWSIFQLRRQMFSIGEDFWIQNDRGENVYRVDGKVLRIRETFVLEDPNGSELATIEAKLIAIRPTMTIERGGRRWATVKKAFFNILRQHFTIEVDDGRVFEAQGDILNHEYEITAGGQVVATISKRWFTILETYGIAIAQGQDEVLMLCSAVCVDEMSEADRKKR